MLAIFFNNLALSGTEKFVRAELKLHLKWSFSLCYNGAKRKLAGVLLSSGTIAWGVPLDVKKEEAQA